MPPLHPMENELAAVWPPQSWSDVTVLLAVSGGADSVALFRAIRTLKTGGQGRLCAAHFNHQLRGDESAADEAFVQDLCRRFDTPCEVGHGRVDRIAARQSDGIEAAARTARYEFLEQTAARLGARYLVTAHTADDQAETVLHRIVRGTGIGGLAGMERARPLGPATTLIRPLLGVRRRTLLAYLDDLRQPFHSDSSNDDVRFTRNRIRHELLPHLAEQYNPGVVDALLRLGTLAGQVQAVVDELVDELAERSAVSAGPGMIRIDAGVLAEQPRYLVREMLMAVWRTRGWPMQAMGFAQWEQLAEMALACGREPLAELPTRQIFPGNVSAEPGEGHLVLRRSGSR